MDPITAIAVAGAALVAKGALETAGQEAGRSGWTGGARLLDRIRARFRGDEAAEGALEEVRRSPGDEAAREELQRLLLAYMLRDSSFTEEMRRLVDESLAAGGGGAQVNAALIKNAQVFHGKVEIQGDWNVS